MFSGFTHQDRQKAANEDKRSHDECSADGSECFSDCF